MEELTIKNTSFKQEVLNAYNMNKDLGSVLNNDDKQLLKDWLIHQIKNNYLQTKFHFVEFEKLSMYKPSLRGTVPLAKVKDAIIKFFADEGITASRYDPNWKGTIDCVCVYIS